MPDPSPAAKSPWEARAGFVIPFLVLAVSGVIYEAQRAGSTERGKELQDRELADLHQDVREVRALLASCQRTTP